MGDACAESVFASVAERSPRLPKTPPETESPSQVDCGGVAMYKSGSSVLETRPPSSCSGVVTDMGEFQHAERAAGTALLALLLLTGVDGLLCPLPDPGSECYAHLGSLLGYERCCPRAK